MPINSLKISEIFLKLSIVTITELIEESNIIFKSCILFS